MAEEKGQINIFVSPEIADRFRKIAKRERRTLGGQFEIMVEEEWSRRQEQSPTPTAKGKSK